MVGPAPIVSAEVRERTVRLDGDFGKLCARLAIPYLSVFEALMATSVWLDEARASDGAHPGAGGYGRLAEIVLASTAWRRWMAQ